MQTRSPGFADCAPSGRIRLDALACWLQDVAYADVDDAGLAQAAVWVVRRTRMRVHRFPRFGEQFELTTFCSGLGRMWAERRTDIVRVGERRARRRGRLAVGPSRSREIWRPMPLSEEELAIYGGEALPTAGSAPGCDIRCRPRHAGGAVAGPSGPTECDIADHVNNAAYWGPLEEELLAGPDPRRLDVELEYRTPSQAGPKRVLTRRRSALDRRPRTASCTPRCGQERGSVADAEAVLRGARRPLVIGMGGGGDVVGALATAELARIYDGADPLVGGLSWERRPIDPRPGPRRVDEIEGGELLAPGDPARRAPAPARAAARCTSPSLGWPPSWTGRRCWSRSRTARRRSPTALAAAIVRARARPAGVRRRRWRRARLRRRARPAQPSVRRDACSRPRQRLAGGGQRRPARRVRDRLRRRADARRGARAARRRRRRRRLCGCARPHRRGCRAARAGDRARPDRGQRPGRARLPRCPRPGRRSGAAHDVELTTVAALTFYLDVE